MSEDETKLATAVGVDADRSVDAVRNESTRQRRRDLIKTGAILLPAVLTLRATPAWAQTDYTVTAYRYGTNQGLCKNPRFNPNANPDSTAGTEFIPCGKGNKSNLAPDAEVGDDTGDATVHFGR